LHALKEAAICWQMAMLGTERGMQVIDPSTELQGRQDQIPEISAFAGHGGPSVSDYSGYRPLSRHSPMSSLFA